MRQDREPTGLLDRQFETSNTSSNGAGALSVAVTEGITRSVALLKTLIDFERLTAVRAARAPAGLERGGDRSAGPVGGRAARGERSEPP